MKLKVVLIDARRQRVTDVEIENSLGGMYAQIGCETIATALYYDNGDCIYVDDEGLLDQSIDFGFIVLPGAPEGVRAENEVQPFFAGNGLLVGSDAEGETKSAKMTAAQLAPFIRWARVTEERVADCEHRFTNEPFCDHCGMPHPEHYAALKGMVKTAPSRKGKVKP